MADTVAALAPLTVQHLLGERDALILPASHQIHGALLQRGSPLLGRHLVSHQLLLQGQLLGVELGRELTTARVDVGLGLGLERLEPKGKKVEGTAVSECGQLSGNIGGNRRWEVNIQGNIGTSRALTAA